MSQGSCVIDTSACGMQGGQGLGVCARARSGESCWAMVARRRADILTGMDIEGMNVGRTPRLMPRTMPGGRARAAELGRGPNGLALCRWCDLEILAKRRRTFCSDYCVHQWRLRTDPGYLRDQVFARDRGICAVCRIDSIAAFNALKRARGPARKAGLHLYGMKSITARRSLWDADHIRPVAEGGGQCDLATLRTLCLLCHREATSRLRMRLSQAPRATTRSHQV